MDGFKWTLLGVSFLSSFAVYIVSVYYNRKKIPHLEKAIDVLSNNEKVQDEKITKLQTDNALKDQTIESLEKSINTLVDEIHVFMKNVPRMIVTGIKEYESEKLAKENERLKDKIDAMRNPPQS